MSLLSKTLALAVMVILLGFWHVQALLPLGIACAREPDVYDEALAELRNRAMEGSVFSQMALGLHYDKQGRHAESLRWLTMAADAGQALAMTHVGAMYAQGIGTNKSVTDYPEALKWFQAAAKKSEPAAMRNLGMMYLRGLGVAKDEREALKWFQEAAQNGDPHAMYVVSVMALFGRGGPRDDRKAAEWLVKAAMHGHEQARKELADLGYK